MAVDTRSGTTAIEYIATAMTEPNQVDAGPGRVCVYTSPAPDRDRDNEDAAAVLPIDERRCVLVLADGFGGHPAGARAAAAAVRGVVRAACLPAAADNLFLAVVDGFEAVNRSVLAWGVGAATTLSAVVVEGSRARSIHVGDSSILVTGQRGRIKLRAMAHSPVGYALESGFLDEEGAMSHEERHIVSNMIGSGDMHIELGPAVALAPRDTLLIGSDGLWDNLRFEEVVEGIRKGPLTRGVGGLVQLGRERMLAESKEEPSKPDDLTVVAYRMRQARS